jgi:hypothetical protein
VTQAVECLLLPKAQMPELKHQDGGGGGERGCPKQCIHVNKCKNDKTKQNTRLAHTHTHTHTHKTEMKI